MCSSMAVHHPPDSSSDSKVSHSSCWLLGVAAAYIYMHVLRARKARSAESLAGDSSPPDHQGYNDDEDKEVARGEERGE